MVNKRNGVEIWHGFRVAASDLPNSQVFQVYEQFLWSGDKTISIDAGPEDSKWEKLCGALYPFSYANPTVQDNAVRKYRFHVRYWDWNVPSEQVIQIGFDKKVYVSMPRIASGGGSYAFNYSPFFDDSIIKNPNDLMVRLHKQNEPRVYGGMGGIGYVSLITYDIFD